MAYPLRRFDPDFSEPEPTGDRPRGPVIVEDEPAPATAPAGSRLPPRRLPPAVSGTDLESGPPRWRPPFQPRVGPLLTGHYLSFLPNVVVAVFVVLVLVTMLGVWAMGAF